MLKSLHLPPRWTRRTTTLADPSSLKAEVRPPTLRTQPDGAWQRLLLWLLAPAPGEAAPPLNRLPAVRDDFLAALADIRHPAADALRQRLRDARSLRELWHARAELYRVVGLAFSQQHAEERVARLNRHFPTRAPRSQFAPL